MRTSSSANEDFLPAALEILDRPPSPLGRILSLTIGALFASLVAWASLGKVDVIVTGQGRVIPSGHVKTIQPFENGVVTAIHVSDGQQVAVGQVLLDLDPTETLTSVESLNEQLREARLDLAVAQALLADDPLANFSRPEGVEETAADAAQSLLASVYDSYRAGLLELNASQDRLNAELRTTDIELARIDESLPLLAQRVSAAGTLLARDALRQDERLALKQALIEMQATRKNHFETRHQLAAMIAATQAQKQQRIADFLTTQQTAAREARGTIAALESRITTESRRNSYRSLTAPVAGFVDQLSVHTIGGVVSAAQTLMTIVPLDSSPEIEAHILNKDVGFVHVGDLVEFKLEAFPFTRYGVLDGQITRLSNDAVAHDQFGLVYKVTATVTTPPEDLAVTGMAIAPGMSVTLEILTEQRRIIEYFLSPLLRYRDEAIRER